jgi:hypothetical protein
MAALFDFQKQKLGGDAVHYKNVSELPESIGKNLPRDSEDHYLKLFNDIRITINILKMNLEKKHVKRPHTG